MDEYFDNYKRQLNLLLDNNRTLKYKYAIFKAVKSGDLVIDFGCGTGILGFFALQAGARHVYAIEETSIIEYAQKVAMKNDLEDKITFIKKRGKHVTEEDIPDKVDLLLSEPVSNLLFEGEAWSTIEYLKKFLNKDASILPVSGCLFMVPVKAAPEVFHDSTHLIGGPNVYNVDFLQLPRSVFYKSNLSEEAWLAKPQAIVDIKLLEDTLTDTVRNSIKFSIQKSGQLYGVEFFFRLNIFGNIMLSSRDQVHYKNWAPLFAPCSQQRLVCPEDKLRITVESEKLGPFKGIWTLEFEHHSKLLPPSDKWWVTEAAIPKLASGVMYGKEGLIRLKNGEYMQYDCDNDLEREFIVFFPKALNCNEICQIIDQAGNYNLSFEQIFTNLVQLLHKLLTNSLIELPIPHERFQTTKFQSRIHIP